MARSFLRDVRQLCDLVVNLDRALTSAEEAAEEDPELMAAIGRLQKQAKKG